MAQIFLLNSHRHGNHYTRKNGSRALKLLSLDGGGVRGLSSLMILRALMTSWNRGRASPTEPWQEFDLIAGTSTGGLLAIMLGRLRMSMAECEKAYVQLAEAIFTPRRHQINIPGKAIDFLKVNGKFDEQPLEEILKQKIKDAGLEVDALLEDLRPGSCKVFVCATQVFDNSPTLLRSYENTKVFGDITDVKIWEAGRATSAASSFFDPITIGPMGEKYADGALHYNNPIELVLQESIELWPDRDRVLISIGTGSAPGQAIDGNLKALVSQLVRIATETEETARAFLRSHEDMVRANKLFRFNVYHGLGEIGLDESRRSHRLLRGQERIFGIQK
ncbi:hypothetical protein OIDMADRAFT_105858 [Oidiodendron maius Zn]|uniref:PNPLA domain-containing protein n=1 Tax=Oidiodendron maius (strain Zn) TaxID=913774 RepID=A0A0C3H0S4_OIDMZ|nr:hypothetical protein OIDMADRAFT_105858 [Oidiodendron maius Zn]